MHVPRDVLLLNLSQACTKSTMTTRAAYGSAGLGGSPFLVVAGNLDLQRPNAQVAKAVAKFGGTTLMNAQNDKGNTGLHFLVQYGYTELAESALPETTRPGLQLAARYLRTSPAESTWQPDRFETLN